MTHYTTGDRLEASQRRDVAQSELLAGLLDKLKATKEPDGSSLLDHTVLAYGSNIRTVHYLDNCPMILAGGGARLKLGQHLVLPPTNATVQCLAHFAARTRHQGRASRRQHRRDSGTAGMRASCLIALVFLCSALAQAADPSPARLDERYRAFFRTTASIATTPSSKKASSDWMTSRLFSNRSNRRIAGRRFSISSTPAICRPKTPISPSAIARQSSSTRCHRHWRRREDHRRPGRPHHAAAAQPTRIPQYHPRSARGGDRRARFADRWRHRHLRYGGGIAVHVERPDRAVPGAWSSRAG